MKKIFGLFIVSMLLVGTAQGATVCQTMLDNDKKGRPSGHHEEPERGMVTCSFINNMITIHFWADISNVDIILYKGDTPALTDIGISKSMGTSATYDLKNFGKGTYRMHMLMSGMMVWEYSFTIE